MKIAVVSDSHDDRARFRQATLQAKENGAEAILHCGDIVAPSTLMESKAAGLPVHAIHGNNTGDLVMMSHVTNRPDSHLNYYGQDAELELHSRKIFLVHYPHYARAMARTGEYDIVCYGHDHHYHEEWLANMTGNKTLLLNPGSVAGLDGPASFMMLDLDTMSVQKKLVE
ncbi:MAG: metallophosphoesterase [Gammaproteobacteria bacterium]|nr:MAG: metallophosphoesterase [Gammaproteobacteria bacterium]